VRLSNVISNFVIPNFGKLLDIKKALIFVILKTKNICAIAQPLFPAIQSL
jgi:hypothetical protein